MWWVLSAYALILSHRFIPPQWRCLTPRKRRAMRLALQTFAEDKPAYTVRCAGTSVYRTDKEKCFVIIEQKSRIHPPCYSVYVVWHKDVHIDRLGTWQFHWGVKPIDAFNQYEQRRAAGVAGRLD